MKKFFLLATIASLALASCDDVPAPYGLFDPTDPNNQGGGGIVATIVPEGDGSAESPFNILAAVEKCKEVGETATTEFYYVKGIVKTVNTTGVAQYGNVNVDMVDQSASSTVFTAYQIMSFGGQKFTSEDVIKVGDTIVVKGQLVNYKGNTPETNGKGTACLVSVNGKSEGGNSTGGGNTTPGEPKGNGTQANPYNVAGVLNYVNGLAADVNSTEDIYFTGKVSTVKEISPSYNNCTFYISEDGSKSNEFYVFRCLGLNKEAVPSEDLVKEGDVVTICGKVVNYKGNTPETVQKEAYIVSITRDGTTTGGETGGGTTGGGDTNTGEAKGDGTQANPYNVAGILNYTSGLAADVNSTSDVYFTGKVSTVKEISPSYNNCTFYISEDGSKNNEFYVYRCLGLNKETVTSADLVKVGDVVTICGKVVNYKGNTPETVQKEAYIVSITRDGSSVDGGSTGGGNTGGGNGGNTGTVDVPAGEGILAAVMASNSELPSNSYGAQAVTDESTWVSWKMNGISYKGVKVCQAPSTQVPNTLQMQGNASDAAKQGFLFNSDAFASDIKKITVVLKVKEATSGTTYDPGYSLYIGASAHPVSDVVEPKSGYTTVEGVRTYVQEFDLSGKSAKYFTIANDKQGALYIDKVVVELK